MMYPKSIHLTVLSLLGTAAVSNATIIGFGNLGGNNAAIPATLASNAAADGNGFVVSNGATPNITLAWDNTFDVHTSTTWFPIIENQTIGGGAWDNEGSIPRVGQLDRSQSHAITFTAGTGFAVVLNSFDLGNTRETSDTSTWTLSLTRVSNSAIVWTQNVTLSNPLLTDVVTVTPNFTGLSGEAYRLTLLETNAVATPFGQHAIDNLSFNQVAVPEPSVALLGGLGALGLLGRRRK